MTQASEIDGAVKSWNNRRPVEVSIAVACDYANVSQDGKLNILGVFQGINAPTIPFQVPQMYIVVSTMAAPSEHGQEFPAEILIWNQDGDEILSIQQPIRFPPATYPGERVINNQIIGLAGLPLATDGDYSIIIRIAGREEQRIGLRVNDMSQQGG